MIRIFFISLYTIFSFCNDVIAQAHYEIDGRIQLHEFNHYFILKDSSNKLTLQDVIAADQKFVLKQKDTITIDPYVSYWVKFSLSTLSEIKNWWLVIGQFMYVDAWLVNDDDKVSFIN